MRRVVRLVLIPSVALIVLWLAVAADLVGSGVINRQVAVGVKNVSIPAVSGLAALQKERQLSIAYVTRGSTSKLRELLQVRQYADKKLAEMQKAAGPVMALAPDAIKTRMNTLTGYIGKLPEIRGEILARKSITKNGVYTFYNRLLDSATDLFDTQARSVPDVTAATGGIAATDMFRISDLMSRAGSLMTGAYASGKLSRTDFLEFSHLIGSYHSRLQTLIPDLRPQVQGKLRKVMSGDSWKALTDAEGTLIARGPWSKPPTDVMSGTDWQSLTSRVSASLVNVAVAQATDASSKSLSDGNTQLWEAVAGLLGALAVVIAAIFWARRRALQLVEGTLVTRLARLRDEAHTLTDERLPRILRWLAEGKRVNVRNELPELNYGDDEIGQVATAINRAQRAAVGAAVKEAEARDGVQAVYLGIARRNQRPLRHVLMQLETWQQEEQDPARMDRWFELDHQVTQAQRNIENLIILGGGQPGRRWRHSVELLGVLRQAISETRQYTRVKLEVVPEAMIVGDAVAGISHLIAEILDNALSFSPPSSTVMVRSEQVSQGVVIEIEDRGLGMAPEARDAVNRMMLDTPELDVMALKDSSQIGFWVIAQLARVLGVRVELRESAYGGIRAIVLLPRTLLDSPGQERPADGADEAVAQPVAHDAVPLPPSGVGATDMETTLQISRADLAAVGVGGGDPTPARGTVGRGAEPMPVRTPGAHRQGNPLPRRPRPSVHAPEVDYVETGASGPAPDGTAETTSWWNAGPSRAEPAAEPGPGAWPPVEGSGGDGRRDDSVGSHPPLPQRQPQRHLAVQLRAGGEELFDPDEDARSPEELRSRFAAFQKGTFDGRQDR